MPVKDFNHLIYIGSLAGLACVLPLSEFLTTVFIVILVLNMVARMILMGSGKRYQRMEILLIPASAVLLYLVWLPFSSDLGNGLTVLRLKLPLLLLPLVIGLSRRLNSKEVRIIMLFFIAGVVIATVSGMVILIFKGTALSDRRELSPFISHIRLALMACLAISAGFYYFFEESREGSPNRWLWLIASGWLIIYLFVLFSFTGLIILAVISGVAYVMIYRKLGREIRIFSLITLAGVIFGLVAIILGSVLSYFRIKDTEVPGKQELTLSGNTYWHDLSRQDIENGHYVWRYVCEDELRKEWNKSSGLSYDGKDMLGHDLRYTLIRYLASVGARKDSAGFKVLDSIDISTIESGFANVRYRDGTSVRDKIYQTIWQIDYYLKGGNPQGHSVTQKVEFIRTGWHLFLEYPLFGTTPGDLRNQIYRQYDSDQSRLDVQFRLMPHNQFLSILDSFGVIGFITFWLLILYPIIKMKGKMNKLTLMFLVIISLSMLGEDTLETHTGITFFSLFYSILVPLNKKATLNG